jgi:extracellular factor (EF) 3-hydroxypalmitic acid methyl ester biosynthesis protein
MDQSDAPVLKQSTVAGRTSQGQEVRGVPVHLDRHRVVFEMHGPQAVLRLSEVLTEFQVVARDVALYTGRAVITNLLSTGVVMLCEASLGDTWLDIGRAVAPDRAGGLSAEFDRFLREWQKLYVIGPEFKGAVADIHTFLTDLRLWLNQLELELGLTASGRPAELTTEQMQELSAMTTPAIAALLDRYEALSRKLETGQHAVHLAFAGRHINPLARLSPFIYRSQQKPLGFAGDYEMVNMMVRSPDEGSSIFGKILNRYALSLPPVVAHRNRLAHLRRRLSEEIRRCHIQGHRARVLSLGCGPAREVQLFVQEDPFSDQLDISLLDFSQETLDYACRVLAAGKEAQSRTTVIHPIKQSVVQILRQASKGEKTEAKEEYDFVYCAGLFDYLSDTVCKALMEHYYRCLAPDGLLLTTNVDDHGSRNQMECFLEWYLIYRNSRELRALAPREASPDQVTLLSEETGVNLFMEVRKPRYG